MAFRMAQDMGLNLDSGMNKSNSGSPKDCPIDEKEVDVRRVTFWGCFLFDKCWSNYLGRLPQLPVTEITVPKYDVFPDEDSSVFKFFLLRLDPIHRSQTSLFYFIIYLFNTPLFLYLPLEISLIDNY
jgi:hypothetical protein